MALMKINLGFSKVCMQAVLVCFACTLSIQAFAEDYSGMWRYTLRPGDNLITLGNQHLINPESWKEVQQVNKIKNPHALHAGKVIYIPLDLVKQGPATAEVIFVSGQVQLQKTAKDFVALQAGQKLGAGASIITKDNSKVVIKFADGTITEMASNSQLKLDTMSLYSGGAMVDTKLRLQKGQLKTHANPSHVKGNSIQVITPSAIAAVRGTKFRVTAAEKVMTQETLEGSVVLGAAGNEVAVDQGFGSKAEQGKPPLPPVVLLPAPSTDSFKKQYDTLPITFTLPSMQGAAAWVGKVASDAKFNQVIAEAEALEKQLAFADVPDGEYYLNLRAKDHNGIAGYDALHQFTLNARPLQPVVVSPTPNGLVREPQPVLQWNAVEGAQLYHLEIASDQAFKQIHDEKRVKSTSYKVDESLAPGAYFWRVATIAKNEQGQEDQGPAINISQFTFRPAPPTPDISQLTVEIARNRVLVNTIAPLDGFTYQARLDNEFNEQKQVWQRSGLGSQFDFLLKEYGKQTLSIQHVDSDGVVSPAAVYEFNASPQ